MFAPHSLPSNALSNACQGEKVAQEELAEVQTSKEEVDEELKNANAKLESAGLSTGNYLSPLELFQKEVGLSLQVVTMLLDGAEDK
jgi:hypothetical protein